MTETITIPLSKLLAWEGNVRKTEPDKGIDELAASIRAHGLLQSLVVQKDKRGKYAVVAGNRRLLALKTLADEGELQAAHAVPCTLIGGEADATEISLVENVQREPMHPADEFDAFKVLIDKGVPVADVAARFGVTETVVQKRLKLARVSPALIAAYRDGAMTLQHIMAFTVTDDQAAQERVWNGLSDWQKNDPENIRDMLTEQEVTAADRRVKFVTLKAYEKAGGTLRRDLFTEDEHGVFIEDLSLLESLVAKKLEKTATRLRKEGWKWVEIRSSFDYEEWGKFQLRNPEPKLSAEEEAELLRLTEERDVLWYIEEPNAEQEARFKAVDTRIDELENQPHEWTTETRGIAGAVVTFDNDGQAQVHAGLVRPEDAPHRTRSLRGAAEPFAASLIENLTAQHSAALAAVLLDRPDTALAMTAHALAAQVFFNGSRNEMALQIGVNAQSLHRVEPSRAATALEDAEEQWRQLLPGNAEALFEWCLAQPEEMLLKLLAFCAARTVNAVRLKTERGNCDRMRHADRLAEALKLEMTHWFTPTAGNYFGKVSKSQIVEALRDIKGAEAPSWSGMKKAELAALAEREAVGTGWLPEPLRRTPRRNPTEV